MSPKKTTAFPEYGSDYSFPAFEEKILKYWRDQKIFEESVKLSPKRTKEFLFYDGPPFATGLPHYGHILAGTIKDIVPRYWTMRGFRIPRKFGWDCHGLPVEFEMEKTLNLSGSLDIMEYGVGKFNEACRGIVLRYTSEWKKSVERMGRWIDMENDYKTMDPNFMESVWWIFKQLWQKGLVYQGKKVVPYSWRLTAALSNFEASQNYKDVQDPAITVLLPIADGKGDFKDAAIAIWTTTPWTLPANLAVAIHKDPAQVEYGLFEIPTPMGKSRRIILSIARAESYGLTNLVKKVKNSELLGLHYEPLFQCFNDEPRKKQKAFRVLDGSSFVSATDGTGIVHMAPAFGEDDYYTCREAGIEVADPTDNEARYTTALEKDPELKGLVGLPVVTEDKSLSQVDKEIRRILKARGQLFADSTLQHAYPFCERSDTPLIYKAISSWFVKVEDIKNQMSANNQKIRWVPGHIKDGRFGKWLENARDWCISRNRFWGTPIPVWICTQCQHTLVVGSREELNQLAGHGVDDLHKHFVDDVIADCPKCKAKSSLKRTPEVLDCWFESGSMPYAQNHYPFEGRESFEKSFPADFIAEGLDQTRGWFYTLTVLSTALFNQPAFKNCIVNGMVLAEDGKKMSKRLKNYPDPVEIFNKHGADALRLYLMQSPAMHAEELRFSEKGLIELMRAVMIPLWNSYSFFASYANIDEWAPQSGKSQQSEGLPLSLMDRWILARAHEAEHKIHREMEAYNLSAVSPVLIDLIDDLTNWYIRLNRDRYWKQSDSATRADKNAAYGALFDVLQTLSELLAPGTPFIAETLHAALAGHSLDALAQAKNYESVHLGVFGEGRRKGLALAEQAVLDEVSIAKSVILLGRSLRGEAKIGLRQPLKTLRVAGLSKKQQADLEPVRGLICDEINIKNLVLAEKSSELVEETIKPNFKVLGKKAGPKMKDIQVAVQKWSPAEISQFEMTKIAEVCGIRLEAQDLEIVRKAKPGKFAQAGWGIVAELDTEITPELLFEGAKREIINRIQQRRKEMNLHLADRIEIKFTAQSGTLVEKALLEESKTAGIVRNETLCVRIEPGKAGGEETDLGEAGKFQFEITVRK
jgi:isoleucyl-tRNA synthetase